MRLWMITAVALSLSGVVFAGRIAYRLTDAPPEQRWVGIAAAVFAGVALLGIQNYAHYYLSAQSDPMIVALVLGAIDLHLSGRPRAAFVLAVLAGLGRPEAWPFEGLYAIWLWIRVPRARGLVVGGTVISLLLWFGIPALTSRSPFVAASNAYRSGRRLTSDQVGGTITRFLSINELPVELAALVAVGLAALRRDRVTLALTGGVLLWVVIEIGFALHGWPGLVRYMFEAGRSGRGARRRGRRVAAAGATVAVGVVARILGGSAARARAGRQPGARSDLACPSGAPGPSRAACADGGDQQSRAARGPARRRSADACLRGAADPSSVPDDARLHARGERQPGRLQVQPGDRPRQSDHPVHAVPAGVGWKVQALHQTSPECRSLPH